MSTAALNFDAVEQDMTVSHGWRHWASESVIARAPSDDAVFERAGATLDNYRFSDAGRHRP